MNTRRMCIRPACKRVGKPTEETACPSCGLPTQPYNSTAAIRLVATAPLPVVPKGILIVTTNDVPGYHVIKVHGDVFGLIVRARNTFSNIGASLRTIAGGEVAGYTKLLIDSRNEARERLKDEARERGANAVIAMRFDCNAIGDIMTEIAAYGTAVTIAMDSVESDLGPAVGSSVAPDQGTPTEPIVPNHRY